LDDAFTIEEKPLIVQGRDPTTYAYQLVTTTTEPHQTQVTTEEHIPGEGRFITTTAEQRPRSTVTISEIEDQPLSLIPQTGEKRIVTYKGLTSPSKAKITRWFYTPKTMKMVLEREDGTRQVFEDTEEMLKLPKEDLHVLQHMFVEKGPFKVEGHAKHLGHQLTEKIRRMLGTK